MALKQFKIRETSWPDFKARFATPPVRTQLLDILVKKFPGRVFRIFKLQRQEKICSHFLMFACDLDIISQPLLPAGVQIARVDNEIVKQIAARNGAFDLSIYQNHLESNDLCYCLSVNGKPASYNWISFSECSIYTGFESKICFKKLGNNEAYIHALYTFSEYRSWGLARLLKQFVYHELAKLITRRICTGIHHKNLVSLKIHMSSGFSLYGLCYNYRLMSWTQTIWANYRELKNIEYWLKDFKAAGFLEQRD